MSGLAALAAYGCVLGWSVAWPPGPINAEMIRRGLAIGFRPAFAVGLGACSGDALWAIAVMLGIGLVVGPAVRVALAVVSTGLLLALAALFLSHAWRAWRRQLVLPDAAPARFGRARGGYVLGLGMALTSPWNLAFWLAVMGRPQSLDAGIAGALTVAGAVLLGAASWCVVLCNAVARLRWRLGACWQIAALSLTGILILGFAAQQAWTLLHV
jgi:threonine/homoserine/homoserine lactone efflux protein